eukprot:g6878.t1
MKTSALTVADNKNASGTHASIGGTGRSLFAALSVALGNSVRVTLVCLYWMFVSLIGACWGWMHCHGGKLVANDAKCWTMHGNNSGDNMGEWAWVLIVGLAAVPLLYVLLPCGILHASAHDTLGCVNGQYRQGWGRYWLLVDMLFKTMLVWSHAVGAFDRQAQGVVLLMLVLGYHYLLCRCQPFKAEIINSSEGSLFAAFATSTAAQVCLIVGSVTYLKPAARRSIWLSVFCGGDTRCHQRLEDGAAIAAMLLQFKLSAGDEYWVIRDSPCDKYVDGDINRMWRRGEVLSIAEASLQVKMADVSDEVLTVEATGVADGNVFTAGTMVQRGRRILRRMKRFDDITTALLADQLDNDGPPSYELSEDCEAGEIDFFISHSWHCDP